MITKKILILALVFAVMISVLGTPLRPAQAAALTSVKDVMTDITAASATPNHTISFIAPSTVTNGSTITVTFPAGFSLTGIIEDDVDIAGSVEGELTTAADCTGVDKAGVGISGQVITFTLCSGDAGDFTGAETITIEIGTNATSSGTGANQIDNPGAGTYVISIGGTMTDSGSLAVSIIADDTVNITSTVDSTITFAILDTTIGFGTLSASAARWATGDLAGSATDSAAAHTMTIATNAASGYAITYNGPTLTDLLSHTISVASITNDADGTPTSEQFAMGFSTDGDATIAAGYDHNATPANRDWTFVASTTTPVVSEIVPTATETISAFYLANIAATTEPGAYSTNVRYVATGTF